MSEYPRKELPMLARFSMWCGLTLVSITTAGIAQSPLPNGVKTLNPPGAISTGSDTWSVGARAGDFIFVGPLIDWSMGTRPAFVKLS
jgi:hypothetical protein